MTMICMYRYKCPYVKIYMYVLYINDCINHGKQTKIRFISQGGGQTNKQKRFVYV